MKRTPCLAAWLFAMLIAGCKDTSGDLLSPRDGGPLACTASEVRACGCPDGSEGTQGCRPDGTGFEACVCACAPDCGDRVCGMDSVCGTSCGSCATGERCTDSGACEVCTAACGSRVCGPDPVCGASCGTCGAGELCEPEGTCATIALTIAGRTHQGATVDVTVGEDVFATTAQADGSYRLELTSLPDDTLLVLHAVGDASSGDADLELYSVLTSGSAARARAGADAVLDESELHATRIDGLSTVRCAALKAAVGHIPISEAEIEVAELDFNVRVLAMTLLDGAVLLDQIAARATGFDLPTGYPTTWALAEDLGALRDAVRAVQPDPLDRGGPLTAPRAALLNSSDRFTSLAPDREYLDGLRLRRDDIVGRGGARFVFESNGRGTHQEPASLDYTPVVFEPLTWTSTPQGLVVTFGGQDRETAELSTNEVVALVDPSLESAVRNALGDEGLDVPRRLVSSKFLRIDEGRTVEWLGRWDEWNWFVDEALAPHGVVTPSVRRAEAGSATVWHRRAALLSQPLVPADVVGRWLMGILAPADRGELFMTVAAGDPLLRHMVVELAADGTGSADTGTSATALDWALDGGDLVLGFASGATQTMQRIDSTPIETGFLATCGGPPPFTDYRRAARVDPSFTFTPASLTAPDGQYWQTTIFSDRYETAGSGARESAEVFGFVFEPSGEVTLVQSFGDPPELLVESYLHRWQVVGDALHFDMYLERNNGYGPCLDEDPRCASIRRRVWRPVAMRDGYLVVLESWTFHRAWNSFAQTYTWDAVQGQWFDAMGHPFDPEDRLYAFYPRLNAYRLETIPSP